MSDLVLAYGAADWRRLKARSSILFPLEIQQSARRLPLGVRRGRVEA
jgi:hypothetical protein